MLPPETTRNPIESRLLGRLASGATVRWTAASGGLSRDSVWRVQWEEGCWAVRCWQAGTDLKHLAWIRSTLLAAESSGLVFVAAPLLPDGADGWPFCDPQGGCWEACAWKPGEPLAHGPDVAAAAAGLARFHAAVRDTPGGPPAARSPYDVRSERLAALGSEAWRLKSSTLEAWPELEPIVRCLPIVLDRSIGLLEPHRGAPVATQPVHGDARPEHLLVSRGALTGLIDFGAMRRDTVLADVARLAGELAAGDPVRRDEVARAYAEAAGVEVDLGRVAALDASGAVLSAVNWVRWLAASSERAWDSGLVRQRLRSIAARLAQLV